MTSRWKHQLSMFHHLVMANKTIKIQSAKCHSHNNNRTFAQFQCNGFSLYGHQPVQSAKTHIHKQWTWIHPICKNIFSRGLACSFPFLAMSMHMMEVHGVFYEIVCICNRVPCSCTDAIKVGKNTHRNLP